jgi:uncharacterized protein YkwD
MALCSRTFPVPEVRSVNFRSLDDSALDSPSHETSPLLSLARQIWSLFSAPREIASQQSLLSTTRSPTSLWRNQRVNLERLDVCAARLFTVLLLVAVVLSANLGVVHAQSASAVHSASAQSQPGSAERLLFEAANRERAAQGLTELRWDDTLANAASEHALLMAQRNTLSHQFPGESALQDRARVAGARFTEIAENVAEGPAADVIHSSWMHSPPHRANLLDPELTAIGIAVVGSASREGAGSTTNRSSDSGGRSAGMLFAVEDFSQSVASLSLVEQEGLVGAALAARGLRVANFTGGTKGSNVSAGLTNASISVPSNSIGLASASSETMRANSSAVVATGSTNAGTVEDARKTCEMERGWAGSRPELVVRYVTGDLSRLPGDLEQKIQAGRYRVAAVGACQAGSLQGFTRFRVAVVLY